MRDPESGHVFRPQGHEVDREANRAAPATTQPRALPKRSVKRRRAVSGHLYIFAVFPSSSGILRSGFVSGYVTGICAAAVRPRSSWARTRTRRARAAGTSNSRSNSYFRELWNVQHFPLHLPPGARRITHTPTPTPTPRPRARHTRATRRTQHTASDHAHLLCALRIGFNREPVIVALLVDLDVLHAGTRHR